MKVDKSLMTGSTTLLILSLLKNEEMYGYQMITELARRSDRTFELKEGTLYPILHTLEAEKLVTAQEKTAENGRMRKYYRITKKGLKALDEKKEEWRFFTEKVNAVVSGISPA
ncbi:MAG: PadR family transcriptional regulator [Ruminococcaceae bacterium]|nr:PadR family transcriptional regulator [Oscillospiraceae bacterium]